jgi:hypothetical protein
MQIHLFGNASPALLVVKVVSDLVYPVAPNATLWRMAHNTICKLESTNVLEHAIRANSPILSPNNALIVTQFAQLA